MIDAQYNPEHCNNCNEDCSFCQDSFEEGNVMESKSFLGPLVATGEKYVKRYAQKNMLDVLVDHITKQQEALAL